MVANGDMKLSPTFGSYADVSAITGADIRAIRRRATAGELNRYRDPIDRRHILFDLDEAKRVFTTPLAAA